MKKYLAANGCLWSATLGAGDALFLHMGWTQAERVLQNVDFVGARCSWLFKGDSAKMAILSKTLADAGKPNKVFEAACKACASVALGLGPPACLPPA